MRCGAPALRWVYMYEAVVFFFRTRATLTGCLCVRAEGHGLLLEGGDHWIREAVRW